MRQDPILSVILAINNDNPYWETAFASIFQQSFKDFEFIVVFNGEDENLWQRLAKITDPRLVLTRTSIRQLSFNLNYGLNLARGKYAARMDADDISHPERFKIMIAFMEQHPGVDVLGTGYEVINEQGEVTASRTNPENNVEIRKKLPFRNPFVHPSVMYKKASVIQANSYLGGKNSEDYSLWLRMARNPAVIFHNLPDCLLSYRVHEEQSSRNLISYAESAGHILCEFLINKKMTYLVGVFLSTAKVFLLKISK